MFARGRVLALFCAVALGAAPVVAMGKANGGRATAAGAQGASATAAAADAPLPSPYAIDIPSWFTETLLDFRDDVADAAREQKRVLVYFGQDGCPYCAALMRVNFSQPDIVTTTRAGFVAIALNIWGDREVTWIDGRTMTEKELARTLGVQFTPTLLFLDEHGGVALRLNGYQPPDRFRLALDYVRLHRESAESFTRYVAAHATGDRDSRRDPAKRGARATDLRRPSGDQRPLLVLFEQRMCRQCGEFRDIAFTRGEVRRLLGRFRLVRVDLQGRATVVTPAGERRRERDWADALRIAYTPSLVFFDTAGNEAFRVEGYIRPFHLASALDYVASGAYRSEPSFQRFVQSRAERRRAAGERVDLWE